VGEGKAALEPLLDLEPHEYAAERNPARVYLQRFGTPASRETMRQSLEHLARLASGGHIEATRIPWHQIRYPQAIKLRAAVAEAYTPKGANLRIAALRGVLKECWRLELMDAEDYQRVHNLEPVRGCSLLRGRALEGGELRGLFEACARDSRDVGRRDAAIFAILYGCALRRAELAALNLADYDVEAGVLLVRGKARRQRTVAVVGNVARALDAWLEARGRRSGPLFLRVDRAGCVIPKRLSPQAIRHICTRRGESARLARFSPHDLRRSGASDLLDAGEDLPTVQRFLGHAKVDTTAQYDRRGDRATRRAAGLLHVPL
jgi:integrase